MKASEIMTRDVKVVDNTSEHLGGAGYPADNIARTGTNVMICGGLGRRAITMFEGYGIMVYIGAQGTVRDAIRGWEEGTLQVATDESACQQHAFRGADHGPQHDEQCHNP